MTASPVVRPVTLAELEQIAGVLGILPSELLERAVAAQEPPHNEGKALMRKKRLATIAATAALVVAGVAVPALSANAWAGPVGGGFWDYGKQGGEVYSNYHHASLYHSATACDYDITNPCQRVSREPGAWAYAHVPDRWFLPDDAFWATY